MDGPTTSRHKVVFLIATVATIFWGIIGFIDAPNRGHGGFQYYSPDYLVQHVERDGPADLAGLKVGDRMRTVKGIPVEELPLYSRWPLSVQPRAGQSLRIEVERDGRTVPVDVTYTGRPVRMLHVGGALIGLAFMICGLWSLFAVDSSHARMLAGVCLAAGLGIFAGGGPYLGSWDGVPAHVSAASMMLFVLLLLRFFLAFPEPGRLSRSRIVTGVIYAPLGLFIICLILELIFHPRLYNAFGVAASLVNVLYGLLALIAFISALILQRKKIAPTGLGLVLIGVIVAVAPTIVAMLGFSFRWALPGSNYYALALAAFPVFLVLAVRKQAQTAQAQMA
ncbi:MAG: PDZ domain-containing protein [Phycisphaerales bacterium]|nr:MAG: PDZ domain-containing protein [Phycisphaerales bacterium]